MVGKNTVRSRRVRSCAAVAAATESVQAAVRRPCRPNVCTVRAPAVVLARTSATSAFAAPWARYAGRARRRYQRSTTGMPTSAIRPTSPSTGESRTTATTMITAWTRANIISGAASRSTTETRVASVVALAVRSPVPARSTVRAGSRISRSVNCSRSRAAVRSPNR